jgi:hypothetical protein
MQKWQQWETASEAECGIAVEREAVMRLLAERAQLSTSDVDEATIRLGISRGVLYKLLRRYKQRPQTSSLLPWKRGRDNSLTFLNPTRESLLTSCIKDSALRRRKQDRWPYTPYQGHTVRFRFTYSDALAVCDLSAVHRQSASQSSI